MDGFYRAQINKSETGNSTHGDGFGRRGTRHERSNSRESNRSHRNKVNDPMRESTMSFFKEAFGIKDN